MTEQGYVYFIECKADPTIIKIGMSEDPFQRLKSVQVGLPFRVRISRLYRTDAPRILERYFHSRFENRRTYGEWFKIEQDRLRMVLRNIEEEVYLLFDNVMITIYQYEDGSNNEI